MLKVCFEKWPSWWTCSWIAVVDMDMVLAMVMSSVMVLPAYCNAYNCSLKLHLLCAVGAQRLVVVVENSNLKKYNNPRWISPRRLITWLYLISVKLKPNRQIVLISLLIDSVRNFPLAHRSSLYYRRDTYKRWSEEKNTFCFLKATSFSLLTTRVWKWNWMHFICRSYFSPLRPNYFIVI